MFVDHLNFILPRLFEQLYTKRDEKFNLPDERTVIFKYEKSQQLSFTKPVDVIPNSISLC